jgi:hypothetical protein
MQKYSARLDSDDCRVVRRWRLRVAAFYGSLVAILLLLSAIGDKTVQVAGSAEVRTRTAETAPIR